MASSPTSSCSSSHSSPFLSSKFSHLPVMSRRRYIVDKVLENRVTMILGETGCGKSSLVPQFLLEENMEPVLCTQPRRFAVIAVAKMVAKSRKSEVGDEVGYHIGHCKAVSKRSKLVFKTAGVLLDEMREKGLNALKYKVIILDEVHERSVESDLVLLCVKQFLLRDHDLRVVLMSATADFQRYQDYFKDLGRGERVEVIAIHPNSSQHTSYGKNVRYLEQVTELLGKGSESLSTYFSGPKPSLSSADMKFEVHILIHDLVLYLHKNEPDIEKSILIFLPTYHSLEQQWQLLVPFASFFKVHILHSSIATEEALSAMKIWKSHRKVILATNIAESSVTIPKVAYVIDSCRSLHVFWDSSRMMDCAKLAWASKSQAEQRGGRTGRTCDGQVFRMVTGSFFSQMQMHESPAILKLSLRLQVLLLCCAESKAINDPRVVLQKALDPPDPEIVEDALRILVHIRALDRTPGRGRFEPTFYGRLITSFSLSFDASILIIKFGSIGMLREGIVLGILMDIQPLPIVRPFGQALQSAGYLESYFNSDSVDGNPITGKKEILLMANLSAYQFWQRVFRDKVRIENLKQLLLHRDAKEDQAHLRVEEQWCSFHNLVQSSLINVSDIYDDVLKSLHRFRPRFLAKCDGLPCYHEPFEFKHTCIFQTQTDGTRDGCPISSDGKFESSGETMKCTALPFVLPEYFNGVYVAERLMSIIREIRVELAVPKDPLIEVPNNGYIASRGIVNCRYFLKGHCTRGGNCMFSHSSMMLSPTIPPCKFFLSLQGCRNGDSCSFSHDLIGGSSFPRPTFCLPESEITDPSLIEMLQTSSEGVILILDDTDLHFTANLSRYCYPSKILCTTSLSESSITDPLFETVRILWGLSHPHQTILANAAGNLIQWDEVTCALWFPSFDGGDENEEQQRNVMKQFFQYLAVRILGDELQELHVVVTMNNLRFSQLQVEKLARDWFFFLTKSFPFDEESFGELPESVPTRKRMVLSRAISYVFDLHPPADVQFGNYSSTLEECLYGVHKLVI